MKALNVLPSDYTPVMSVDLQNNKATATAVNIISILLMALMVVPVMFFVPLALFASNLIGIVVLFAAYAAYIVLHELTHAAVMRQIKKKKVHFGFTGLYFYAGSNFYFDRKSYILIALAPVVLFGLIFGAINVYVPANWFWVVYLLQVFNISGAAGDFYVTFKFSRLPRDILIHDSGTAMTVFAKKID